MAEDLDTTSLEEIQELQRAADEGVGGEQRSLGDKERSIQGKRQLIEANKVQYSRVSWAHPACNSPCAMSLSMIRLCHKEQAQRGLFRAPQRTLTNSLCAGCEDTGPVGS